MDGLTTKTQISDSTEALLHGKVPAPAKNLDAMLLERESKEIKFCHSMTVNLVRKLILVKGQ